MNVNEKNKNNKNKNGRCSLWVVGSSAKEYNGHLRVDYADKTKRHHLKVTRPSFFWGVPSYFEALWYPHFYFYRKSNK